MYIAHRVVLLSSWFNKDLFKYSEVMMGSFCRNIETHYFIGDEYSMHMPEIIPIFLAIQYSYRTNDMANSNGKI